MNLPAIAVEFLDAFPNLLRSHRNIPTVKVYFYIFASNIYDDAKGTELLILMKCFKKFCEVVFAEIHFCIGGRP